MKFRNKWLSIGGTITIICIFLAMGYQNVNFLYVGFVAYFFVVFTYMWLSERETKTETLNDVIDE